MTKSRMNPKPVGEEPEPRVPVDLQRALVVVPLVEVVWKGLTPIARRDFIYWIDSAKQPEIRRRQIENLGGMLTAGKRRPCCFTIVPMNLYKALAASPKARLKWKALTPSARRDFVSWIDEAQQPETNRSRIEKACVMLASGKQRP